MFSTYPTDSIVLLYAADVKPRLRKDKAINPFFRIKMLNQKPGAVLVIAGFHVISYALQILFSEYIAGCGYQGALWSFLFASSRLFTS